MQKIKFDDLEMTAVDGGGEPMYAHQGKPFTGIMIDYENDGSLAFECEYQNGYLEGWCRYYYPNGQIEEEYQLHNNIVVSGTLKTYDENGNFTGGF